jgi:hypothetical protein
MLRTILAFMPDRLPFCVNDHAVTHNVVTSHYVEKTHGNLTISDTQKWEMGLSRFSKPRTITSSKEHKKAKNECFDTLSSLDYHNRFPNTANTSKSPRIEKATEENLSGI